MWGILGRNCKIAWNCLESTFDCITMQMTKVTCKMGCCPACQRQISSKEKLSGCKMSHDYDLGGRGIPYKHDKEIWVLTVTVVPDCRFCTRDHHQSSHYTSALWHIQVMRIKKVIIKDELSWCLNKFSQLVFNKMWAEQWGEFVFLGE